jgi:hypothetical protein
MMTQARGSSNAKAKRALDWQPIQANWRDGFRRALQTDAKQSDVPAPHVQSMRNQM